MTVAPTGWLRNLVRYSIRRLLTLAAAVVLAVFLTIIIANLGGYVDEVIRAQIDFAIVGMVQGGWLRDTPEAERMAIIEQTTQSMQEAAGLNEPFLLRTVRWLKQGLTLDWRVTRDPSSYTPGSNSRDAAKIILDHLSRTAFVFGSANLLLFFVAIGLALPLTRNFGGWLDRLFVGLLPLSAAPAWVYGVVLNIVLLRVFSVSIGGTFDAWPAEMKWQYLPIVLKHLLLPFLAIFLSGLFQGVYAWRTFFLIYANEDYVEMARAKGLSHHQVERRYILRPALPGLITSFALMAAALWQEVIALEFFFNIDGIGRIFLTALRFYDTPMIVALVVTFAYLLAITVFVLDIVYAMVDPRVRLGGESLTSRAAGERRWPWQGRSRPARAARLEAPTAQLETMPEVRRSGPTFREMVRGVGAGLQRMWGGFRPILAYPSAIFGLLIILTLIAVSIYTVKTIPYRQAVALWRGENNVWVRNPRNALPAWVNLLRRNDLPPTLILDSHDGEAIKSSAPIAEGITQTILSYPIDFPYHEFPEEMVIYFDARFREKNPHVTLTWLTPDGREIELTSFAPRPSQAYHLGQDERLARRLSNQPPEQALFATPGVDPPVALPGRYELRISALTFEADSGVDAELVIYGRVYGLAGTDGDRRDLMVALLWGAPVALVFGLAAAVATSVGGMVLAAVGAWFSGWIDGVIQLFTEVNLILPFFPVSLMIYTLYSKSLWMVLGVTVALSIFGHGVKTYRAAFLQIKVLPYIEAARAYGAGNWRIVRRYLMPRITAILIPKIVILIPGYVFLEATLAFLGLGDPVLPTWGKLVVAALTYGVYRGQYHLVLAPLGLLFLTGIAFALVGRALEEVFEPRLRHA